MAAARCGRGCPSLLQTYESAHEHSMFPTHEHGPQPTTGISPSARRSEHCEWDLPQRWPDPCRGASVIEASSPMARSA
jgi:hypothetical protein